MTFTEVRHLPIVKEYAKRLNLVETIDQMANSQMELSPGIAVLAMVLDTLSRTDTSYLLVALLFLFFPTYRSNSYPDNCDR